MAQTLSRGPVTGTAVKAPAKKKPFILDLYSTAVGKKYVMAITGLIGIGFVITHMIGNLKMYLGVITEGDGERVYDIDIYGEFLRELLVPILPRTYVLWGLRLVLIGAVLLHIHAAYGLTQMNRQARAVKYQSARDYQVANFASRSMRWTGIDRARLFIALAPRRPHVGLRQSRLRSWRRLLQHRRIAVADPGRDPLHRGQRRSRHPPVPRHVVAVPVDGLEQPPLQRVATQHRRRLARR